MDLVGAMLFEHLSTGFPNVLHTEQIRPSFSHRFGMLPGIGNHRVAHTTDRLLNRFIDYPRWLRKRATQYDIFHIVDHSYAQLAKELPSERTVITCHDLDAFQCMLQPERYPRPKWFQAMTRRILDGLQQAAHVFCVSQTVRDAVLAHQLLPSERISVAYNGVHPVFQPFPDEAADAEADRLLSASPNAFFLLSVSSTIPRKRLDVLLKAFSAARKLESNLVLLRVGGKLSPAQRQLAESLQVDGAILELPFLSSAVLAAVYRRSFALIQTSEAEGFGLPLIEAMASGCPVIASDIAVHREIGGDGAIYCKTGNYEDFSTAILILLHEKECRSAAWQQRSSAAMTNADRFSWTRTTHQLFDVYQTLLKN